MKNNRLPAVITSIAALICIALLANYLIGQGSNTQPDSPGATTDLVEGTHYRELKAPLDVAVDGVSVMEFFWYGCPHCQKFEPRLKQWLASAPEDVRFAAKPVAWNEPTQLHGAMYFVGLQAQRPAELHEALFDRIIDIRREKNLDLHIEHVSALFAEHGIADLKEKLQAGDILSQVKQAAKDMRQAEVSSTPAILVAGRYQVLNNQAVSDKGIFNVIDSLVAMSR